MDRAARKALASIRGGGAAVPLDAPPPAAPRRRAAACTGTPCVVVRLVALAEQLGDEFTEAAVAAALAGFS